MWFFRRPNRETVDAFLASQREQPLTYQPAGATRGSASWPAGFNHDRNSALLGEGAAVFAKACAALRAWRMFPAGWTVILPENAPQEEGCCVALLIRAFGVWWLNSARIVYTLDSPAAGIKARAGFAYGTLPGHVESGEECFSVVWSEDGTVRYHLDAFSRPRLWLVRLAKPIARRLQRKFIRESLAAMQHAAAAP
jgi:uncharacterized protein (UPF0548 family)